MTTNVLPFDDHSAIKAQAREWLIRLDRDDAPSQEDLSNLHQWAAQSPAHQAELERISAFWQDANVLNELSTPVYDRAPHPLRLLAQNLWRQQPTARLGAIAASACIALVMVFTLIPLSNTATNGIYISQIGEVQEHKLADGSTLQLNTNSQVQVQYSDLQRKITLIKGEAHFEVAPNKQWPFEVYAGKGMVKALGTAFSVRLDSDNIQVIVSHGQVELAAQRQRDPQPITDSALTTRQPSTLHSSTPNSEPEQKPQQKPQQKPESGTVFNPLQTVTRLTLGQSTSIKNAAVPHSADNHQPPAANITEFTPQQLQQQLSWRTGYLIFGGEPLSEVIREISRYTSVNIEITEPSLEQLRVGGRFKVGELDAMFEVLETGFGIKVSRIDDHNIQLQAPD